ncbi:type-2 histone deacetylase 1-like [Planococcus citri]|uniref:type-2 histone deacetylase 1-like n=1 Tax=Planococcus citri TaxID=170843 RepID=UPI0031F9F9DA
MYSYNFSFDMKMNMTFMVLLNFLRVNTQMTGLVASSKNFLSTSSNTSSSHILRNKHLKGSKLKNATILSPAKSKSTLVHNPTLESGNWSSIELYSFDQHIILSTISNYIEKWLLDEAVPNISLSTNSQIRNSVKPSKEDPSEPFKRSIQVPVLSDVRFFQSWREEEEETGTEKIDNGNFTLTNSTSSESDEYDLYTSTSISNSVNGDRLDSKTSRSTTHASRMKAILVKDTRYRSLMKKWITNRRHGRARGDFSQIHSNSGDNSTRSNVSYSTNPPPISNSTSDEEPCIRENKTNTSCNNNNSSSTANDKSTGDDDDPEARFYDPLMPYPEEYPEEYQTIQNGPALIISRTTYTRIPNVTYTTITMVTLPTYRLVEKAENAFAATLFEERSSKSSKYLHSNAGCDTEHHSSTETDFLQHSRR